MVERGEKRLLADLRGLGGVGGVGIDPDATDLHVDVSGNVALVRVRVDGRLEPLADGHGGKYPRAEAVDALAAGYNNTRQGNNVSQYTEDKFVSCMIGLNLVRKELEAYSSPEMQSLRRMLEA